MSTPIVNGGVDPVKQTALAMHVAGFDAFDPAWLLANSDGRVAVLMPDGSSSVQGGLADALRWREANHPAFKDKPTEATPAA